MYICFYVGIPIVNKTKISLKIPIQKDCTLMLYTYMI